MKTNVYYTQQLWENIDKLFCENRNKFLNKMSPDDKILYETYKYNLLSILNKIVKGNKTILCVNDPNVIKEKIKKTIFSHLNYYKENYKEKLLETALRYMLVASNLFIMNENYTPIDLFEKNKISWNVINAYIKDISEIGTKYMDI